MAKPTAPTEFGGTKTMFAVDATAVTPAVYGVAAVETASTAEATYPASWWGFATHQQGDTLTAPNGFTTDGAGPVVLVAGLDGTTVRGLAVDASGNLQVDIVSGGSAGVQYDEGVTDASITGTAIMWEDAADTLRAVSVAKPLPVAVQGTVPVSGTVAVSSVGGTVTVGGTVAATQSGAWDITNITGTITLPTGAATAALQTQPGVDIGDVTINNAAGASAVNIQDGGNSITVDGTVTVNGTITANLGTIAGVATETTLASLLTELQSVTYAEDSVHATTNPGLFVLAVATDGVTALVSADGDYTPIAVNGDGNVWVNDPIAQGFLSNIASNTSGNVIGYGEDLAHSSLGTIARGAYILGRRNDGAATTFVSANDDLSPMALDAKGRIFVYDDQIAALLAGPLAVDTELDTPAALADNVANPTISRLAAYAMVFDGTTWDRAPGTAADGTLVNLGANNDVTVTAVTPGTAATNLGKAEDAAHTSGDVGVMMLGVRQDTVSVLAGTTGDYLPPSIDQHGFLRTIGAKRSSTTTAISAVTFDTAAETSTSSNITSTDYTHFSLSLAWTKAGSGVTAQLRVIVQWSNDGGTVWFEHGMAPFSDVFMTPDAITASGVNEMLEGPILADLMRIHCVSASCDGTNNITLTAKVQLLTR